MKKNNNMPWTRWLKLFRKKRVLNRRGREIREGQARPDLPPMRYVWSVDRDRLMEDLFTRLCLSRPPAP